jgi:glycosyltransferase involved in cell wall biosynthesis
MRILHILPSYYPAVRYGGPIYSVHGLARAQRRRGHDVHVYTTNVDGRSTSPVPVQQPVDVDGVQVWYFPTGLGRRIYRSPPMGHALLARMNHFDILHNHCVFLWPTMAGARAARRCNVPYIISPHGMLVPDLIRRKSLLAKHLWITMLERHNIENAAAIHFTSQLEADEFRALGFDIQDSAIVPNGLDIQPACPKTSMSLPRRVHKRPYVLYLGRISWKKRVDDLIRAIGQVQDLDLVIAGNDDEGLQPSLVKLSQDCGAFDRVHFVGHVGGDRKWDLFRSARVFVLPSRSENFGMAVLEAMSAGCPVIVTAHVGLASSVRETGAGLVIEDAHPAALANAIRILSFDEEMGRRMGAAGKRAARELFSWDGIAQKIEDMYSEHCSTC